MYRVLVCEKVTVLTFLLLVLGGMGLVLADQTPHLDNFRPVVVEPALSPPKLCENGCCVNCGKAAMRGQNTLSVQATDGSTQNSKVNMAGRWRAACSYGMHSGGGAWFGPVRNTYAEAKADANFHNLGGAHSATVTFFLGQVEATELASNP